MNPAQSHIPTEVYFDFLGGAIPIHWNYHALLMVGIWLVLVPICIITIRYGKPRPTPFGIRKEIRLRHIEWWWFSVHKFGFYIAIGLSLAGGAVALAVSRGFSGSVHSIFGIATIALGCLQIVSAWLRGTHGGRYYFKADPNDPSTWRGDHFDMTPRRRKFEAYHKTAGYFAGFFAVGAMASGLMQYPMPILAGVIFVAAFVIVGVCIFLEYKGLRYDGYRAAFGNNPDHPYNKARRDL
ncbi:MAG TPA: cytochrome b561 domain-containing protein [Pseudolabrys sp.]|nr:cytochrome b561 domain-containing protein [Pseudolabrys sp.]